jgi:hypothetical protein
MWAMFHLQTPQAFILKQGDKTDKTFKHFIIYHPPHVTLQLKNGKHAIRKFQTLNPTLCTVLATLANYSFTRAK